MGQRGYKTTEGREKGKVVKGEPCYQKKTGRLRFEKSKARIRKTENVRTWRLRPRNLGREKMKRKGGGSTR